MSFQFFVVPLQPLSESCCVVISPDGGIGRRAGLKHQWGNPCRFDPGSGYNGTKKAKGYNHTIAAF